MIGSKLLRVALAIILISLLLAADQALPPNVQIVLNAITAAELRGDLSFLASDALQGRYTPSPGLEVAAEFIASRFRAAGLEPGGDREYFQTASMLDRHLPKIQTAMAVTDGSKSFTIPSEQIAVTEAAAPVKIDHAPVLVVSETDPAQLRGVDLTGKAIVTGSPDFSSVPADKRESVYRNLLAFRRTLASSKASAGIFVVKNKPRIIGTRLLFAEDAERSHVPLLSIQSEQLESWLDKAKASDQRSITLDVPGPEDRKVVVKNVVGVLPGSDAALRETCVLLTAHYDHIGTIETADGMAMHSKSQNAADQIYNGANDDGSGTVSVIEIARALARLQPRPRRSIVFMTFFGEERGELGSQYYGRHPFFPISKTVADINLEQVGRTDSTEGRELNNASLTGYDYSDVTKYLEQAGRQVGIRVYKDAAASDEYFTRSDNDALAQQGVPAHSLTVAFDYPDYHGLGDEWQKIDYNNMAKVDRMIALGLMNIANSTKPPAWNSQNPKTASFREAQQKALGH